MLSNRCRNAAAAAAAVDVGGCEIDSASVPVFDVESTEELCFVFHTYRLSDNSVCVCVCAAGKRPKHQAGIEHRTQQHRQSKTHMLTLTLTASACGASASRNEWTSPSPERTQHFVCVRERERFARTAVREFGVCGLARV